MPQLAPGHASANMAGMKLFLAVVVYLLIGVLLGWGILLMLAGKPWLLIAGLVAYLIAFSKIGCASH